MQPGWEFLDEMKEAGSQKLTFGAALPLQSEPRHYQGAIKGSSTPPASLDRETAIRSFLAMEQDRSFHALGHRRFDEIDHQSVCLSAESGA